MAMMKLQALLLWEPETEKTARINSHNARSRFKTLELIEAITAFYIFCDILNPKMSISRTSKKWLKGVLFFAIIFWEIQITNTFAGVSQRAKSMIFFPPFL